MATTKRRDQVITADDLREYLSTRDDFALELFVYQEAKKHRFLAKHGGTYTDPVTNKPRQFDVRAYYFDPSFCRLDLAIECKSLQPTYPLLLSRIPRATAESFHQLILFDATQDSTDAKRGTVDPLRASVVRHLGSQSIYHVGDSVGKTMTQVGRDDKGAIKTGDDGVYDKWSQALASADELVSSAAYGLPQLHNKVLTFVLPVLVVSDGTLWAADYSEDGREISDPVQIDEGELFVGREYGGGGRPAYTISHLHIVTKSRVGSFFDRLYASWRQIFYYRSDSAV